MECFGPECAAKLLEWLEQRVAEGRGNAVENGPRQGLLFSAAPYDEGAPAIRNGAEMAGALEHLEYAVFRRFENQLTRAERARLDNSIDNALFKMERYVGRSRDVPDRDGWRARLEPIRQRIAAERERQARQREQARRADAKLAQLDSLSPEAFEDFVAELFEALGHEVDRVGGTGDQGADLLLRRGGQRAVVQCKYHSSGVIGSPELQRFLGTVHHTRCHKGYFVTTRTFSLAAERFAADHPIELVDGPRLVELVREALGPGARVREPRWF
jgi:restriction system protein